MPSITKQHIGVELWEVIMQLLNSSFVFVETHTMFVNVSRKYLLDEGVECVCPCAPICFDADCINCVFGVREKKRERKNNRRKKQRGSCGSRRLPGIVRATEERGRPRKSETITKRARPISGNHTDWQQHRSSELRASASVRQHGWSGLEPLHCDSQSCWDSLMSFYVAAA